MESLRTIKLEYLRHKVKTVATLNKKKEYEIKPTKNCQRGETVWIIEADNTFVETKIF